METGKLPPTWPVRLCPEASVVSDIISRRKDNTELSRKRSESEIGMMASLSIWESGSRTLAMLGRAKSKKEKNAVGHQHDRTTDCVV